jgi:hypothetical protein
MKKTSLNLSDDSWHHRSGLKAGTPSDETGIVIIRLRSSTLAVWQTSRLERWLLFQAADSVA